MKKIIRKLGTSIGIIFNKEEQQILDLKVGDIVDLSDMVKVIKKSRSKNAN